MISKKGFRGTPPINYRIFSSPIIRCGGTDIWTIWWMVEAPTTTTARRMRREFIRGEEN